MNCAFVVPVISLEGTLLQCNYPFYYVLFIVVNSESKMRIKHYSASVKIERTYAQPKGRSEAWMEEHLSRETSSKR